MVIVILSMLIFFWIAVTCSFAFDFIKGDESGGASGYTELADDLNRDLPQEEEQSMMGDPMLYTEMSARDVDPDMDLPQEEEQSMIGDPMLYTELSASSYQNVGPDSGMYTPAHTHNSKKLSFLAAHRVVTRTW